MQELTEVCQGCEHLGIITHIRYKGEYETEPFCKKANQPIKNLIQLDKL